MSYLFRTRSDPTLQKPASSEEQQRKVDDVRELLGDLQKEKPSFLSDGTIRRFLRAKNWSTEQAAKALKGAVKWRRQYKPEEICWSLTSTKERMKQLVYNLENMAMNSDGTQEENVIWMCNFRGWTLSSTPLWETRESLHIIQNYYPGLIGAAILSNPPKIFESFWKIVKRFIEPTLEEKVKFVYSNNSDSQRIMSDMFDMDKLESAFGGRNTASLDISKYAERMRRRDQLRGACKHANSNISSS
ncbi:unnamed protein product [Urochloa decumbens]|uniref:CRAL-TRIO domain-containing protein n=1 Tax=Urochloa decumbens TaxID=240449 RepID=A0ABC8VZK8_9POAL